MTSGLVAIGLFRHLYFVLPANFGKRLYRFEKIKNISLIVLNLDFKNLKKGFKGSCAY